MDTKGRKRPGDLSPIPEAGANSSSFPGYIGIDFFEIANRREVFSPGQDNAENPMSSTREAVRIGFHLISPRESRRPAKSAHMMSLILLISLSADIPSSVNW